MKFNIIVLVAIATLLFLAGCAPKNCNLSPIAMNGQNEIYRNGIKSLLSTKQRSEVIIRPEKKSFIAGTRLSVVLSVKNKTQERFEISPDDINIFANKRPVKIFSHEELVAEQEEMESSLSIATALEGFGQSLNAVNAGTTYYNDIGAGTMIYSHNPSVSGQARQCAIEDTSADLETIHENAQQSIGRINATILQKTTILPNELQGGHVVFGPMESRDTDLEIVVCVNVAKEIHQFKFKLIEAHEK